MNHQHRMDVYQFKGIARFKLSAFGRRTIVSALSALGLITQAAQIKAQETGLPEVMITGMRLLPGLAVPRNEVAAGVQVANGNAIAQSRSLDLADFMHRNFGSVYVNETQGNPFQSDVNYRGYTASPLLGTPQGLSVLMDGVRMNQPFGDVVSWDLIPKIAIKSVTLVPGSNPLFGLNTLGGALSIETKDGRSNPGTTLNSTVGSNARRSIDIEHGGSNANGLDWFTGTSLFKDTGWRESSPSSVKQLFGKLGWRDSKDAVNLSISHANNQLNGNGLQEQRFLERDWRSVYTRPDITDNRSTLINLAGSRQITEATSFSGNMYYRKIKTGTFNADVNEEALNQALYQPSAADRAALAAAGYRGYPVSGATAVNTSFPFWRCIAQVLQRDEPAEKCNGLINRSTTAQNNHGFTGQWSLVGAVGAMANNLMFGAAYDASKVDFRQSTQLGYLNADRSVTGVNAFGDGVTGGDLDGDPYDTRVDLSGKARTFSVFVTDTLSITRALQLTLAGRYNQTRVTTNDRLHLSGGPQSLDGEHRFSRFNPAVGLTFSPTTSFNSYIGYNQGTRAPSAIELGCANPEQPCKLPNAMAGDPPLRQVVAKTWEAGVRGSGAQNLRWNAGLFGSQNLDDILFVADLQAGYGYFKNFGKTRRQGIELGVSDTVGRFVLSANYTLLDATFRSFDTVNGSGNSSNDKARAGMPGVEGTIAIRPGDRMPQIPRQILKLNAEYQILPTLSAGVNMLALSGVSASGNENSGHAADGRYYLGAGKTAGYAIFNLGGSYKPNAHIEITAQINNLFDRQYATAARLGATAFDGNGNFIARPFPAINGQFPTQQATFYAPGAQRLYWLGLRYTFDRPVQ